MILPVLALIGTGLFASFGSYYLKRSTSGGLSPKKLLLSPWLYLGGMLYVCSAMLNLYALRIIPYSIVVPVGALSYVWTIIISHVFLKEKIIRRKVAGVALIILGVGLVAFS